MTSSSRKAFYFFFCLSVFVCLLFTDRVTAEQKPEGSSPVGTWKLISTKYGNAKEFAKYPGPATRLKIINPTHFTWVEVDEAKHVQALAGGRYTLSGEIYTETIDFAGDGMQEYLGKPQKFAIKVDGDKLFQSGTLSDGLKIEENWERVK